MKENHSNVAFFAHEYPTWITDEIIILRKNGIKVQVFSFLEKSIFNENIINNNIDPIFIKPSDKNLYRIIGNFIKSPVLFGKLLIIFISIIIKYNFSWKSSITSIPCILEASRKINKNAQFIHAHFANMVGLQAALIAKILKLPFSVTVHAGDIYWPNLILKFVLDSAMKISSENKHNIDYLVEKKDIEREKIFLSYMGVLKTKEIKYNNKKLNKKSGITLGSLALFVEQKGLADLIEAVSILIQKQMNIILILGGDGPLKNDLMEKVTSLKMNLYVYFEGFINTSERERFFEKLDVFCLPSVTDSLGGKEGIPVVLMEAMAFGIPVISTRHSGIPELIIDGYTGMLVGEHRPVEIAEKVEIAINNPKLLNYLSKNAYEYVSEKFDMNKNIIQKAKTLGWLNNS